MVKRCLLSIMVILFFADNRHLFCSTPAVDKRKVVILDGQWQVAQGSFESIPETFDHVVVVPGLLDMAEPAFTDIGKISNRREAFWYRKKFKLDGLTSDFAILKIHKAKYETKVYLNRQLIGEHWPCFTPGYFNVKNYILDNSQENELIICVGANREAIPEGRPTGWDFEKYLYIPGIYDRVELILSESPQSPNDAVESHPYLFIRGFQSGKDFFQFKNIASISGNPRLRAEQQRYDVPVIVNEYAWLWLNRDGSTTTLTKNLYNHFFGENSSSEERFFLYARYLAALTEFWRSHRRCAGVLHFCGLGYARSGLLPRPEGGATSDHFIDLEALTFEPNFERYVRDAFSPVGLMINFWQEKLNTEEIRNVDVTIINDLPDEWQGPLYLYIKQGESTLVEQSKSCILPPLHRKILSFSIKFPSNIGVYDLIAEIYLYGDKVRSTRRFTVQ